MSRPGAVVRALLAAARRHARKTGRVARWEVSRTTGTVDRKTAALGAVALLLTVGVAAGGLFAGGVALDDDIYAVAVSPDSPYHDPVSDSTPLEAVPVGAPGADVYVDDRDPTDREATVSVADTRKGQAALGAFRSAVERHNTQLLLAEENQSAAFPVGVTLSYVERASERVGASDGAAGAGGDGGDGEADAGGAGPGGAGDGSGGSGPAAGDGSGDGLGVPDFGGVAGPLFGGQPTGSPAEISPPFPFSSLVLAFAFLVPMNFVIQAYGSTVLNERINRRGELLLVAPLSPGDIVAGKTLPYAAVALLATALIAAGVGGGPLSVAAVFPIALVFLASTFVGAMFARSFKELTFVTVTVSVTLTTYAFVPAIFATVTPIALISPLTIVVRDLQGEAVVLGEYLFSTGPFYLTAATLFAMGVGVYREEDMFTQRSVPLKFLDALAVRLHRPRDVALLSALSIPFVFVAELLGVALLFALPQAAAVVGLLVIVAVVEEIAKGVAIFAGFHQSRFERDLPTALKLGALSGAGFFLAEKATAIVQVVGLGSLPLGQAAFGTAGVGAEFGPALGLALLALPLLLHVVTAAVGAVGATRGWRAWTATLLVAMAIHFAYDLTVVSVLG
ncbi:PrsW family intramembrane metalloprotease [Halobaculum magnesiiphilum]|uniref:PrsW family intramembrane metalloprotease n=1 Tax=Halobaculum magnesiiphilum TaxID=1017351 RepID=A0A8T8WE61_9EURY|nr:PrsW family intramembrane metalloprotease [Halobaculum magnesiiphilum]QZP38140.1 PrsW family intramembrane metalloprotease [Halobaculum magnesiiphilum]